MARSAPDRRVLAARELLRALRKANPIVLDTAAKEAAFRFQSGLLGAGDAARLFEQLQILGWDGTLEAKLEPAVMKRFRLIASCRLCGVTFTVDPPLGEAQIRVKARDLSPPKITLHQDLFLPGECECLGVAIVQGLVIHE